MPISFWFFLGVCILSFVPVIKDHGESWREYKSTSGKTRRNLAIQLFALWAIPVFTAIGTVVTGIESVTSGRENAELHRQAAESNEQAKQLEGKNLALRKELTKLELAMSPRRFRWSRDGIIERLRKYAGTEFIVATNPDTENPFSHEIPAFAQSVSLGLLNSGWVLSTNGPATSGRLADGVDIEDGIRPGEIGFSQAALALETELKGQNIPVTKWINTRQPAVVVIRIGPKPSLPAAKSQKAWDEFIEGMQDPSVPMDEKRKRLEALQKVDK